MGLADTLETDIRSTLETTWDERNGTKVPEAESVGLSNAQAVKLEATVLYADLAGSTKLVRDYKPWFCAKVYKAFLGASCKILRQQGGAITSFDGDRVMAVFIGDAKNTSAVRSALAINHMVKKQLTPQLKSRFTDLPADFEVQHGVGVDSSELFAVRTGIRANNDLAWIGTAANYAAKLSEIRESPYNSFISSTVFDKSHDDNKYGPSGEDMWNLRPQDGIGVSVYRSSWWWPL